MAQMRMKMRVKRGKAEETESAPPVCRSNINAVQSQIYRRMHYIETIIQMQNKYNTNANQKKQIACQSMQDTIHISKTEETESVALVSRSL